jgi:hypothetical protein
MFDRLDLERAFAQRRGAVGIHDLFDARFDLGLAIEVDPAEADTGPGWRGQESHVDAVAAVQADA